MAEFDTNRRWQKNNYREINWICIFNCLKKTAAIFLLGVMLFNLVGYRWIFTAIESKATSRLEQKISAGYYSEDELIEIQIPLNMPYYSDKDYENVYGETDWNGNHYRYVKRKVSGNTLYLLCLPHTEKNSIIKAKDEFTKGINDVPVNKQGSHQKSNLLKLLTTDFRMNESVVDGNNFFTTAVSWLNRNTDLKDFFIPLTDAQPPES